MTRGTTPTHTFILPFDTALIQKIMVIQAQNDQELFHKELEDCVCAGNEVKLKLTQEDTLKFDDGPYAQIQIRVLTVDGNALASVIQRVGVQKLLNDEVL